MLLGIPRSGTNFVSSLIKAHPLCELQIEPFSMHLGFVLDEEFTGSPTLLSRLGCRCDACFVCDLQRWLLAGLCRGFKETALFDVLPALKTWAPGLRVIFLQRDVCDIVSSYVRHGLVVQWNLRARAGVRNGGIAPPTADDVDLVHALVIDKLARWREHRELFDYVEIDYRDICGPNGLDMLDRAMRFIGLSLDPRQEGSFYERLYGEPKGRHSTFGGARLRATRSGFSVLGAQVNHDAIPS